MSKRKSLARLAVEKSQSSQDLPDEAAEKTSSNARPLAHPVPADRTGGATRVGRPPASLAPSVVSASGGDVTPSRRRDGRGGDDRTAEPVGRRPTTNRHSYPAAAPGAPGQLPRLGWEACRTPALPLPSGHPPQKPPRGSLARPGGGRPRPSVLVSVGDDRVPPPSDDPVDRQGGAADWSPPVVSLDPPADAAESPPTNNGHLSPAASSDSSTSGGGDGGGRPPLLTARHMHHARSTNDLQGGLAGRPPARRADASPWNGPMAAGHRTRSFPSGLAGSVETLSSCSEPSAGSPLNGITVQKARSRGYLVNQTGSALLLSAEELDISLPQRQLHVLVGTWNMNAKESPPSLDDLVLPDCLSFVPDLVVLGTQESHADHRGLLVRLQSTLGPSHVLFHSATLGTLHVCVFIRRDLIWYCSVPEEASYSIRQPTAIKTKGCVAIGFQFFGTTFLLLTCHLTAHLEKQNQRIDDVRRICAALDLPQAIPSRSDSRDVTERYDNVFWFGDLNFRLHQSRPRVIDTIVESSTSILLRERTMSDACMRNLLEWDQLNHAKQKGRAFEDFCEGEISFLPTYKYDPGTDTFDTSHKQRIPAYTDRILYKSRRDGIRCVKYDSVQPFNTSDHKPVWGLYQCQIRPSMDSIPLAAGQFNRAVFLEGLRRRARHLPAKRHTNGRPCSVQ